jgi:hypothetical protein
MRTNLFVFFSIFSLAKAYVNDRDRTIDKIVQTIIEAAQNDKNQDVRNSKYFSSGVWTWEPSLDPLERAVLKKLRFQLDQLNLDIINPYNGTINDLFLEQEIARELKKDLTSCEANQRAIMDFKERADYFTNVIGARRLDDTLICPVFIPLIQREHELVMGLLLNRLRRHVLKVKKCSGEFEHKDDLAGILKKVSWNRFGDFEGKIMSCDPKIVTTKNSCIHTGLLKAGADE